MNSSLQKLRELQPTGRKNIAVHITPAAERALRRGHPWLFENSIRKQSHAGQPGDLAVIFDQQRRFLAVGLYDPFAPIRVRVLQHRQPATINAPWFQQKFATARQRRASIPAETNGYRLIHGENDGFPGLVLDQYAQTWVVKLYSAAWIPHLAVLLAHWMTLSPARILLRLSRKVAAQPEGLYHLNDGSLLYGAALEAPVLFQENGLTFEAAPIHGHKTGFYLDQRENRARVEKLARRADVLNIFAYTGGFSLYAARGGAKSVTSVDLSQPALEAAQRNFEHNQKAGVLPRMTHRVICGDAFEVLQRLSQQEKRYDLIVIDPPAFATRRAEIQNALRAYRRLTRLGLQLLKPGGTLVQASCSSRVKAEPFFENIHRTARQIGVSLNEIERTGHPVDHPIAFPEGAYLKCLFAEKATTSVSNHHNLTQEH